MMLQSKRFADESHIYHIRKLLWGDREFGRAAIMVGAGFSRNAEPVRASVPPFPLWDDLASMMEAKVHGVAVEELAKRGRRVTALRAASNFEHVFGRPALDDFLRETLADVEYLPGDLHHSVLSLPWSDVFTTNFDTLLERARAGVVGRRYEVVVSTKDVPSTTKPRIVKLHGSFPSHRPFIITEEDYRTYPRRFAPFVNMVQQSIMENAFCLLGFRGDDPNFLEWTGWVRDNLGDATPTLYLVGPLDMSPWQRQVLAKRYVTAIDLGPLFPNSEWPQSTSRHREALRWFLESLQNGVPADPNDWPTVAAVPAPVPGRGPIPLPPEIVSPAPGPRLFGPLAVEDLESLRSSWAEERRRYPGWLVCPADNRDRLWEATKYVYSEIVEKAAALPPARSLTLLFELEWRLERIEAPAYESMSATVEAVLRRVNPFPQLVQIDGALRPGDSGDVGLDWEELGTQWIELAFFALKSARPTTASLGGGQLMGESEIKANLTRGLQYRRATALSPRGQVLDQVFGDCSTDHANYDDSTGQVTFLTALRGSIASPCPTPTALVRQLDYAYDHFLNLQQQVKNYAGGQATEVLGYDDLQRLTSAQRSWTTPPPGYPQGYTESVTYAYDDLGNITSKSDYASQYVYGGPRPHAVTSLSTGATFGYDANGNMTTGSVRSVDIDLMDRPVRVTQDGTSTDFAYAPDGSRYRQVIWANLGPVDAKYGPKTVYYVDKDYELSVWGSQTEERTYVGGAVVLYRPNSGTRQSRYQHLDRLGSVDAVTTPSADGLTSVELPADAHGYDPFGKPRAKEWTPTTDLPWHARLHPAGDWPAQAVTTDRGFTGHEHLDVHYLIHMNGRMYDYGLGRFLSVDPIISNPMSSQAINPYSYIGNNPLSGVDPTGYAEEDPAGTADHASDRHEKKPKPNDRMVGIRNRSVAGFAGDTVTLGGRDADALGFHAEPMASHQTSSGPSGAGTKADCTNATDCGSAPQTGQKTKDDSAQEQFRLKAPGLLADKADQRERILDLQLEQPPPLLSPEGSYAARWYAQKYVDPESSTGTKALALTGLILSSFWTEETASTTLLLAGSIRNPNKLSAHPDAAGPHTSFRVDPRTGRVTNYETYQTNPRTGEFVPVLRFRGGGGTHGGQQPPLVLEPRPGKGPGAAPVVPRPPTPEELPRGY